MNNGLDERDWKLLLQRISDGKCTPFLGPGVSESYIPNRHALAQKWATEFGYPFSVIENNSLARVAQYLTVEYDPLYPKEEFQKYLQTVDPPDFNDPNQPHAILADLPLPIYITTNYDNFMMDALVKHRKNPRRELCRWNPYLLRSQPSELDAGYTPSSANPLVYHLYGFYQSPESLVLTEDDYMDFLVNISSDDFALPPRIQQALADSSLLFIGFNPYDWDFRVLFRGLVATAEASLRRISVTVQLPPLPANADKTAKDKIQQYLSKYFDNTDRRMRVYWVSTDEFMAELKHRLQGIEQVDRETEPPQPPIDLMKLQTNLEEGFDLKELRSMVQFKLKIDYETFPGTKPAFIMELITYMQRRQRLYELVETCQQLRPKIKWM